MILIVSVLAWKSAASDTTYVVVVGTPLSFDLSTWTLDMPRQTLPWTFAHLHQVVFQHQALSKVSR